jgi:hypothetical protein
LIVFFHGSPDPEPDIVTADFADYTNKISKYLSTDYADFRRLKNQNLLVLEICENPVSICG